MRFDFFEPYHKIKLGDITREVKRKTQNSNAPVRMISYGNGFIMQSEKYSRDNAGSSLKNYTLLFRGEFAYNHGASKNKPYGVCYLLQECDEARIPFVYHSFSLTTGYPLYWHYALNTNRVDKQLKKLVSSGVRMDGLLNISYESYMSINIYEPTFDEQLKIAKFLTLVDKRIETQNKIISALESQKKALSQHYFKQSKIIGKDGYAPIQLKKILIERKTYSQKDDTYPHVTLSKEGIYDKGERYNRDFLVKDENKEYKITLLNDICYNPANLKFGVICRNTYGSAIFSPIYVTYEINHQYDPHFIELYLTHEDFIGRVLRYEQGTVYERMAVSSDDFLRSIIYLPSRNEQERISKIFSIIENKLSIEQAILQKYKEQKKFLLSNMFI